MGRVDGGKREHSQDAQGKARKTEGKKGVGSDQHNDCVERKGVGSEAS